MDHPLPVNLEPFRRGISPEKRFIPCCRLARRLERFVGGSGQRRVQLINKSSVAEGRGWYRGLTRIKGREIRSVHRFISTAACRYLAKRSYTRVHTHIHTRQTISHLQFKRERDSRVLNEELVVFGLDAAALAGHHGPVHSHQPFDPRLKPMAVPLRRKLATCNTHMPKYTHLVGGVLHFFHMADSR